MILSILTQLRTEGYDVTNSYDDAESGDLIWVQITHADEHDVWGVRVEDEEI